MRDDPSLTRRMIAVAERAAYRLALAVVLLSAPCTADESPVALRTTGGEAWSFEKLIETSVPAGDGGDHVANRHRHRSARG
jgi:hypothetical protein